jgi:hypothetical protein
VAEGIFASAILGDDCFIDKLRMKPGPIFQHGRACVCHAISGRIKGSFAGALLGSFIGGLVFFCGQLWGILCMFSWLVSLVVS